MTWTRQVLHVVAKDARYARWGYVLYAALIVIATLGFTTGKAFDTGAPLQTVTAQGTSDTVALVLLPMVTFVLAGLGVAALVQQDSPTRPNAFWTSRPLQPSAVLSAKLVAVVALGALPLIGSAVALQSFALTGSETAVIIGHAALMSAAWFVMSIAIAALTDSLISVVGAFVAMFTALTLTIALFAGSVRGIGQPSENRMALTGIAAGLVLAVYLYRTHDRRRRVWGAAALCMCCVVLGAPGRGGATAPVIAPVATLHPIVVRDRASEQSRTLVLRFPVSDLPDGDRLDLRPDSIIADVAIGKPVRVINTSSAPIVGNLPPLPPAVHWIAPPEHTTPMSAKSFSVLPSDWSGLSSGIRGGRVLGTMTLLRASIIGTLPLTPTVVAVAGRRFAIEGTQHNAGAFDVMLGVARSEHPFRASFDDVLSLPTDGLQFALVNAQRGEAIALTTTGGGESGQMLSPWISVSFSYWRLTTASVGTDSIPTDDAWYRNAKLLVWEWRVVGRYPVNAPITPP